MSGGVQEPRLIVSVIVIADERLTFVREALRSLEQQTLDRASFETILVLRGHDYALETYCQESGITLIHTSLPSLGAKMAMGATQARGEVVAFLEDDDLFAPDKLAKIVRAFQRDSDLVFLKNGFMYVADDGLRQPAHIPSGLPRPSSLYRDTVIIQPTRIESTLQRLTNRFPEFNNSSISVRKSAVEPWLPMLSRMDMVADAFLFYSALAGSGRICISSEILTKIRLHGANLSGGAVTSVRDANDRLAAFSQRNAKDNATIATMLKASDSTTLQVLGTAFSAVQEAVAALRDAAMPSRSRLATLLHTMFRTRRTFIVASRRPLIPLLILAVIWPTSARWLYSSIKFIAS